MQHVDRALELDRVDRPEGVAIEIRYDLENACTCETGERLGVRMLATLLRRSKRKSDAALDLQRKPGQVLFRGADELQRFIGVGHLACTRTAHIVFLL